MEFCSSFDHSSLEYKIMFAAFTGDSRSFRECVVSFGRSASVSLPEAIQSIRDPRRNFGVIHMAASSGNLLLCKHICEDLMIHFDDLDGSGQSPLFYAALSGRLEVSSYLLCIGADLNKSNVEGYGPLHCAVLGDCSEMIRYLLTCGAFVDLESREGTPLHIAALSGSVTAVKILLENGANVHIKSDGRTPLAVAILCPSTRCVKELVRAGARISDTNDIPAMIWSAHNGLSDCIRRILETNADLNVLCDDETPEEFAMMPYSMCWSACHKRARFAVGCCGRCYCTVDHLLENHPCIHPIGVPKLIFVEETLDEGVMPIEIPGCILPDCPPWWLCKIERRSDEVRLLFKSSDPTVGSCMVHSYPIGQNEPMVQF